MVRKTEPTKYEKQAQERIKHLIDLYYDGSQQKLAEYSNVNKASISQYVNGKNVPSNLTAKKIGALYGINPAWIMGFDVPMYENEPATKENRAELIENSILQDITKYFIHLNADNQMKALIYVEKLFDLQNIEEGLK